MSTNKFSSKPIIVFLVLAATVLVVAPHSTNANESTRSGTKKPALEDARNALKNAKLASRAGELAEKFASRSGKEASRAAKKLDKCEAILKRLEARVSTDGGRIANKEKWVADTKAKWAEQVTRLKARGINTTKYEADIVTASGLLDKWLIDVKAYWTQMKDVQKPTCGDAAALKEALAKAIALRKLIQQDRQAYITFRTKTMIPDLNAAIKSLKSARPSSAGTATPSATTAATATAAATATTAPTATASPAATP